MDFENEDQAKEWIILNQFGRRNLDNWQRGKLATKLESLFAEKAKANMKAGVTLTSNEARVHTSKELANISGLSRATIERVQRILSNATPQTITLLDKGEISISKAYENTQGRLLHNKEMERQNAMLSRMEAKVERGFASANKALIQIKESESYKEKCSTWDDYLNSSPFSHLLNMSLKKSPEGQSRANKFLITNNTNNEQTYEIPSK